MGLEMGDATETGLEDKDDTRRGNAWPVFECRLASSICEGDSRTSGGRSNERREEGERERRHDGVAVVASFREREEAQALQRRDIPSSSSTTSSCWLQERWRQQSDRTGAGTHRISRPAF
ncbi:hypothetical protein EDB83DRAFT_2324856 [Lactarius deliciosus]|nr:hypothetical protein EDB83DRAFT_2324856 [Lactarius deliciosus]